MKKRRPKRKLCDSIRPELAMNEDFCGRMQELIINSNNFVIISAFFFGSVPRHQFLDQVSTTGPPGKSLIIAFKLIKMKQ